VTTKRAPGCLLLKSATTRVCQLDLIARLGQVALAMKAFGAHEGDAQMVSMVLVAGCELYVGMVAWCAGSVPAGLTEPVSEAEYTEAVRLCIPRLLFLAALETQAADGPGERFPASVRDEWEAVSSPSATPGTDADAGVALTGARTYRERLVQAPVHATLVAEAVTAHVE
jgi:hypothetical protein